MIRPYKKGDKLDPTVKKFLGVKDESEVKVVTNQKAEDKKLLNAREQYLLAEACEFGDILVSYIGAHPSLDLGQRAWAVVLALLCQRADYPEGVEKFDELADQGGKDLQYGGPDNTLPEDEAAAMVNNLPPLEDNRFEKAAQFAETFSAYISMKKQQLGVSNPQAAYGLGRAFHNLRLGFPKAEGGSAVFDEYARRAGRYYDEDR